MEPEDVAEYSRASYWDERYKSEPQYEWFSSVYPLVLEKFMAVITQLSSQRHTQQRRRATAISEEDGSNPRSRHKPLQVLHLGCGNSSLCRDLAALCDAAQIPLQQTAIDYSAVVIDRMSEAHREDLGDRVTWLQGDVRSMPHVPSGTFDVVMDKGTMDALQADKSNDCLEEDLAAMLLEVSRVLKRHVTRAEGDDDDDLKEKEAGEAIKNEGLCAHADSLDGGCRGEQSLAEQRREDTGVVVSAFLQVTWEIPYYRFHYTKRPEYAWGARDGDANVTTCKLGDSDLYRFYKYEVWSHSCVKQ